MYSNIKLWLGGIFTLFLLGGFQCDRYENYNELTIANISVINVITGEPIPFAKVAIGEKDFGRYSSFCLLDTLSTNAAGDATYSFFAEGYNYSGNNSLNTIWVLTDRSHQLFRSPTVDIEIGKEQDINLIVSQVIKPSFSVSITQAYDSVTIYISDYPQYPTIDDICGTDVLYDTFLDNITLENTPAGYTFEMNGVRSVSQYLYAQKYIDTLMFEESLIITAGSELVDVILE